MYLIMPSLFRYAREDTHYLLYIYDLMRLRLVKESSDENDLLLEVRFLLPMLTLLPYLVVNLSLTATTFMQSQFSLSLYHPFGV
jgi:hypothetical protein